MYHSGFKIILYNEKKIRLLLISILLILPFLLLADNVFLDFKTSIIITSIVLYSALVLVDVLLLFVKENLELKNLIVGIQFLILSMLLFINFTYTVKLSFYLIPLYIFAVYLAGRLLYKRRFFSYKSSSNKNQSYAWLGVTLGLILSRNINIGEFYKKIVLMICCCVFSLLLMFFSVQIISKYVYITKYKNTSRFYYEYE